MICNICPRKCKINRTKTTGFCGQPNDIYLAKADLFFWEEPVISGKNGSGAIFFSGCNLKCCFCQNYQISSNHLGKKITVQRLAEIFKELEQKGAHNINLVSPSHYALQIKQALDIYRPAIPIVYNSNGYEDINTLKLLKNYIDVYLVDFKFFDEMLSQKYCKAKNYPNVAKLAISEMINQQPKTVLDNGILQKGVVVRHMIMPNCTTDSKKVLDWLAHFKTLIYLSLMCQYTPCYNAKLYDEINRTITPLEYKIVLNYANKLQFDGFSQDLESAKAKYIPIWDFNGVE